MRHPPARADLEEYAVSEGYQEPVLGSTQPEVEAALETLVREGARRMLAAALEEEVTALSAGTGTHAGDRFVATATGIMRPER